jgi:hypothetical protein
MNNRYGKPAEFDRLIRNTVATAVCIGMGVGCPISLRAESGDAETQPYAKVCLSVVTDTPSAKKEEVFKTESLPGPGTELVVHTVASEPCGLLVAAFSRENEDLAHGWRPEFVELAEQWKEVRVPKTDRKWLWEGTTQPFEVYVLILSPNSPNIHEIKQLTTAMQQTDDDGVLQMQSGRLHALITGMCGDKDLSKHVALAKTTEVAGATRGSSDFDWRSFASRVSFSDRSPGLVIFRSVGWKEPAGSPTPTG